MSSIQINWLTSTNASEGFSSDCLGNFSIPTCQDVDSSFINTLTNLSFGGFKYECIASWNISVINNMTPSQISQFTTIQCGSFNSSLVTQLYPNIFGYFTAEQQKNFSQEVVSNLSADQLAQPYAKYQEDYFSFYPSSYFQLMVKTVPQTISVIKAKIDSRVLQPFMNGLAIGTKNVTWLMIASINDTFLENYLASSEYSGIINLEPESIYGIRAYQVSNFTSHSTAIFSKISAEQGKYIGSDVLNVMTVPQYLALSPTVYSNLNISAIPPNIFPEIPCSLIKEFSTSQIMTLSKEQNTTFVPLYVPCVYGSYEPSVLWTGFGIATGISVVLTIISLLIVKNKQGSSYEIINK